MDDTSALSPVRWGMIFVLLSMDVTQPFVDPMGLQLEERPRFVEMLRRLILENRKAYEADPTTIPPLADRVLREVEATFGKEQAERLYQWAREVFIQIHADGPQWSAWRILFHHWTYDDRARARLDLPSDALDALLVAFPEAMDRPSLDEAIAAQKAKLLSDWDLEMYAIHGFNNDDVTDPFETVLGVVEMHRFQRFFWPRVLASLSPEEKASLQASGQRQLEEMGVWMPGDLAHPDALGRRA